MALPTLTNPTGRKTPAHIMTDAQGNEFFFSYETCIAYRGSAFLKGHVRWRRENDWGPTTGRHFNELDCENFDSFTGAEFEKLMGDL